MGKMQTQSISAKVAVKLMLCVLCTLVLLVISGAVLGAKVGKEDKGVEFSDFTGDESIVSKVFNVTIYPDPELEVRWILSAESVAADQIAQTKMLFVDGNRHSKATDYIWKNEEGNRWLTHSVNYDPTDNIVQRLDFFPPMFVAPRVVQVGIPWGGGSQVEVTFCHDGNGNPTGEPLNSCGVGTFTEIRFHLETRTMLGIEDVEVDGTLYKGCLKTREDRMSNVWGPDRSRIRFRCPEYGLVRQYQMTQLPSGETDGRLYDLDVINYAE